MVIEAQKVPSPEEEIRELERRLEEKKREFADRGEEVGEGGEKEVFKEVLREHIEGIVSEKSAAPHAVPGVIHRFTSVKGKSAQQIQDEEEREENALRLIEIALTKGIREAARVAQKESPYMLDELHDHLVDDCYDKLIALRKIKEL
ncbi:MAG: hypothetical protein A3C07_01705 [Candidatus Sungbacteria bacterium RIFCSPHIGHO2_02_FULL_47_11]|uniref:Uncharacterized protein n=1 Tax=Candidatus Sungbacteria bacterium RIFCSPHIGHO2_02_FULL_47_11 TaxID=1802270 RepID=A0A1G2KFK8_9BACT|nr:MAG: hypothetical protein A3C07_01705 [Candidatus Sungbacteria bacterium RIFCSPHIGHO2_02_FULL_47_11]